MFQGPKCYIEQMCDVHLKYGSSTTKWLFYTFSSKFHSIYNLFSLHLGLIHRMHIDISSDLPCKQSRYSFKPLV